MHGARATTVDSGIAKGSWSEIFRNGLRLYSALVIGGIAMNATQMLVIAIIMPTIVRDVGGASFYTWAARSSANIDDLEYNRLCVGYQAISLT